MRQRGKQYAASFTIEAAVVMAVVLTSLCFVIKQAYILHDEVTGSMILMGTVLQEAHAQGEEDRAAAFAREGSARGNPRLWLGEYRISLQEKGRRVSGSAQAGDWTYEIEREKCRQEDGIRLIHALMKRRSDDDGNEN